MKRSYGVKRMAVAGAVLVLGLVLAGSATAGASTDEPSAQEHSAAGASADHGHDPAQAQATRQNEADHGSPQSAQASHGGSQAALDQPQPRSNADNTGHGANQTGAYDSTRDGSPSGNGNGGGAAVGKPCAGCVGKADNKNPPGQFPNGTDANNGYECDGNHGIGRTNPAHTGCATEANVPLPPTPVTPTVVSPTVLPTSVLGLVLTRPARAAVAAAVIARPAGSLPRTGSGSGLAALAMTGLAMILIGALLLGRRPGAQVIANRT
jgi:LPXTG-motif cell wall-anchored protein